ncbi:hypothetical protein KFK09_015895 [Dendrobium nobile]|uniref:Uncharacterized protein n=1 Tax=Dendrobium nobile TaxID=94219 RepID=A0A8T3B7A0_DENNO|nr:hypothetical protein KFK09_015895 [Dendrobium nobile]
MPIYELCHSKKSINRALILHKRGSKQEEEKRRKRRKKLLLDHRRNLARPPQLAGTSPNHRRSLAGPPPELAGPPPELRCTTTSRPDV